MSKAKIPKITSLKKYIIRDGVKLIYNRGFDNITSVRKFTKSWKTDQWGHYHPNSTVVTKRIRDSDGKIVYACYTKWN